MVMDKEVERSSFEWTPSKRSLIYRTLAGYGSFQPQLFGMTDIVNSKELIFVPIKKPAYWKYESKFSDYKRFFIGLILLALAIIPLVPFMERLAGYSTGSRYLFAAAILVYGFVITLISWQISFIGANKKFVYNVYDKKVTFTNKKRNFTDLIELNKVKSVNEEFADKTIFQKILRIVNFGWLEKTIRLDYEDNEKIYSFRLFGIPKEIYPKLLDYLKRETS